MIIYRLDTYNLTENELCDLWFSQFLTKTVEQLRLDSCFWVLSRFSTTRLFLNEATFFVAKTFDNGKYKKHSTNKIRSSRPEVFSNNVFVNISQKSQESTCARVSFVIKLQPSGLRFC